MTRKDFKLIADVVRQLRTFEAHDAELSEDVAHAVRWSDVADRLATALATTNARFDRERFLEACGNSATPAPAVRCDQCEASRINGVFCHETGCPNSRKTWDADRQEWVKFVKCFTCGCDVEEGQACCEA